MALGIYTVVTNTNYRPNYGDVFGRFVLDNGNEEHRARIDRIGKRLMDKGVSCSLLWNPAFVRVVKRKSLETKQKMRRTRLANRLKRRFPMFWEQFWAEEVAKKPPEYYGINKAPLQAHP